MIPGMINAPDPGWAAQAVAQGAIDLRKAIGDAKRANVHPSAADNHGFPIREHLAALRDEIDAFIGRKGGDAIRSR